MNSYIKYIFISTCLLLSACSFNNCDSTIIDRPKLNLKDPNHLTLSPIKFKILHKDNSLEYFDSQQKIAFTLTETDYKNLALNMEKLKAYIIAQRKIIHLYRNYYEVKSYGKNN